MSFADGPLQLHEKGHFHVVANKNASAEMGVEAWLFMEPVQRALLVGRFDPADGPLAVSFAPGLKRIEDDAITEPTASNWGVFYSMLNDAYRPAVERGLLDSAREFGVRSGRFTVAAAGEDPFQSSEFAFRITAYILAGLLVADTAPSGVDLLKLESMARSSANEYYRPSSRWDKRPPKN